MSTHRVVVRSRASGERREEADTAASLVAAVGAALDAAGTGRVGSLVGRAGMRVLRTAAVNAPLPPALLTRLATGLGIDATDGAVTSGSVGSLWRLATRRLPAGARPLADGGDRVLVAPCDGRLRIWPVIPARGLSLGGVRRPLATLLADEALAAAYERGSALRIELAGFDPHRLYAPVGGLLTRARHLPAADAPSGPPSPGVRLVRILTVALGDVTILAGGGSLGGETRLEARPGMVERGAELGTIGLGGAALLVLLEPGRAIWDPDLLDLDDETLIRVRRGERLALRAEPGSGAGAPT